MVSKVVAFLYTQNHVRQRRMDERRAHLARMGGAPKTETAAACPRLLG
jgi:hypothetical protein